MGKIKGWKNTSETFSDGSKSIEWRSKTSKVNVWSGLLYTLGQKVPYNAWNWSVNSTTNSPTPYMIDTGHKTKEEVMKLAMKYMRSHPNG